MKSKRLPEAEFQVMQVIWDGQPPVTTSAVMEKLGRERGWKIQTVVSLFGRLTERGFLRVEPGAGRGRAFYPLITREDYLRMETESFVSRYHNNSVASLIGALRRDELTEADLDELTRFVKEAREKGR